MRRRNGFTLLELLMSLSMMSIIGLSIAGLSVAVGNGYAASEGYSDALQSGRSTMMRLAAATRKAKLIVASTSSSVTFWAGDTNADGLINLDEIKTVIRNTATGEIVEIAVNFGNAANKAALNVSVPLANVTTVSAALTVQQGSTYCVTTPLASGVSDFQVKVSPAAPMATRLNLQITLGTGEQKLTLSNTSRLRADATLRVGQVGSNWVLAQ